MFRNTTLFARRSAVWLLRKFNPGDITLRHHFTRDLLTIDAFKHRQYWFRGKHRESDTMKFLSELINVGDTVLEAGGHIGYLSLYFAQLCGATGQVIVFEPDPANLRYLRQNAAGHPQMRVIEQALGSSVGPRDFFVENLSGQNNSLYVDYDPFKGNAADAGFDGGGYRKIQVVVNTIDGFCRASAARVNFVKLDIEGAEFEALCGMEHTVAISRPLLMVEITRKISEAFDWLTNRGYLLFNDRRQRLRTAAEVAFCNVFCFHAEGHTQQIVRLGLTST